MAVAQNGTLTPSTSMARPMPKRRPTRVGEVEVKRVEGRLSEEEVDKVTEVLVEAFAGEYTLSWHRPSCPSLLWNGRHENEH